MHVKKDRDQVRFRLRLTRGIQKVESDKIRSGRKGKERTRNFFSDEVITMTFTETLFIPSQVDVGKSWPKQKTKKQLQKKTAKLQSQIFIMELKSYPCKSYLCSKQC